ncbi:MAG: sigma-70 family RNA polymerase sigma factor [Muribaculaceae bacterium]|nr:sigma-70 family RNA polymerase sigma factor [Muribaculaceae bacterium]
MDISCYTDQEIAQAILRRDTFITKEYLYRKCYPLFKAIHNKFYTDCETPIELINQIYVYILWPNSDTHKSKLENFGFRCSLPMWLKIVTEHYCQQLFKRKIQISDRENMYDDRKLTEEESITQNTRSLDKEDLRKILSNMPSERYGRLIELRYIRQMSNEETARMLGINMDNYYNCHKRAKEQYCEALRKEGLL